MIPTAVIAMMRVMKKIIFDLIEENIRDLSF